MSLEIASVRCALSQRGTIVDLAFTHATCI